VLRDPKASRSQALVYLDGDVARLLVLGRGRTVHNGERVERDLHLNAGDRIELPSTSLEVGCSEQPDDSRGGWVLEQPGGGFFGVPTGPFVIGGSSTDDLQLEGWPDHALVLHLTQRRMHLAAQSALTVDGEAIEVGALVPLTAGSRIAYGAQTLRVVTGREVWHGSTVASEGSSSESELADHLRFEFLPRGGRLRVRAGGSERAVYLPGQRSELMALLLRPPAPYEPGQALGDEMLIERLWPKQARSRIDLNTLVYRLRKDLACAGIDASGFVVRAQGGGGTLLGLAKGARVEID